MCHLGACNNIIKFCIKSEVTLLLVFSLQLKSYIYMETKKMSNTGSVSKMYYCAINLKYIRKMNFLDILKLNKTGIYFQIFFTLSRSLLNKSFLCLLITVGYILLSIMC